MRDNEAEERQREVRKKSDNQVNELKKNIFFSILINLPKFFINNIKKTNRQTQKPARAYCKVSFLLQ